MTTRQRKRSRLRRLVLPIVAAAYLGYFGFHAFNGYYGLWAKERLERTADSLQADLAGLKAEREALERRIVLLRPESLDADLIDERARQSLNLLAPGEVILSFAPQHHAVEVLAPTPYRGVSRPDINSDR